MALPGEKCSAGFSLIELLVVLVIVGALASVGVYTLGNRSASAVRQVLDELEGTLLSAQKLAVATGQDVLVATQGEWSATTPLALSFGNATLGGPAILLNGQTDPASFLFTTGGREFMSTAVVTATNPGWWGTGNTDINTVAPFNDPNSGFQGLLTTYPNLFQGGAVASSARISGINKRFTTTFWIEVVAFRGGGPVAGGPMGLLVVQANGASIYKFYNPGVASGGAWRRM